MNRYDHDGRVALVTGGASGIGEATITKLQSGGARVASFDLVASDAADVISIEGDVTSSHDLDAAVARVEQDLGSLDILVCCAGIAGESIPVAEVSDDEWNRVLTINATGVFLANRAALPGMIRRGRGRIVNVASVAGKDGSSRSCAYSASKAAVIAITKAIGKEVAGSGVLVNSIAPAVISTPILEGVSAEAIHTMVSRIPLGRVGEPHEVAALIAFLVSDDLSFATGACFDISGGTAVY